MTRINPALRVIEHSNTSIQIGLGASGAVVEGLLEPELRLLKALRIGVADSKVESTAAALGVHRHRLGQLLCSLEGFLIDDATYGKLSEQGFRSERNLTERMAILARYQQSSPPIMERRDAAVIHIVGLGRLGTNLALLLAHAGVGTLLLEDDAAVSARDVGPTGFTTADIGLSRSATVRRLTLAASPATRTHVVREGGVGGPDASCVDLAVVVTSDAVSPALAARFMNTGRAHLFVLLREQDATLGPLVIPGETACAECVELHRSDNDPLWQRACQQLSEASGNALLWNPVPLRLENASQAMAIAGTATAQALLLIDGVNRPSVWSAVMTLHEDNSRWTLQEYGVHPACGCQWQVQALATISSTASP